MWEELGEEFCEQMNAHVEKEHTDWRPQGRHWKLIAHLSRLFWCYLGQFCQIDIYGGLQANMNTTNAWKWKHRENFDKRYSTIKRARWWTYIAISLYAYSSMRLVLITYHQYLYDFHFLRLQVLKALTSGDNSMDVSSLLSANTNSPYMQAIKSRLLGSSAHETRLSPAPVNLRHTHTNLSAGQLNAAATGQLEEFSHRLEAHVRALRTYLKSLGSPYINQHYGIELIYEFLFESTFVLVVVISVYYKYVRPFNFGLARAFLDYKHERRLQNRLVLHEVNKFITSSGNFTQACVAQIRWRAGERRQEAARNSIAESPTAGMRLTLQRSHLEMNNFLLDHISVKRQLKQMALNGLLLPVHRTARWVEQTAILTVFLDLLCMGYSLIATLFFAFIFFALSDTHDIEIAPVDILVIAEAGIQVAFIIFIGIFFITQIIANCVDQIYYSVNMARQIRFCILQNQQKLHFITKLHSNGSLHSASSSPVARAKHKNSLAHFRFQEQNLAAREDDELESLLRSRQLLEGRHEMEEARVDLFSWRKRNKESAQGAAPFDFSIYCESGPELETGPRKPSEASPACERRLSALTRALLVQAYRTQMNSDLLKVIMQHKIFVAQIKPLLRSFGTFASAILLLLLLVPLNVRIHSPYLDQTTKLYSMSFNLLCITIANMCYIPLCYMHSRCVKLYKCQSSLMAHVVEVASGLSESQVAQMEQQMEQMSPDSNRINRERSLAQRAKQTHQSQIYHSHSIWLLRKELNDPRQFLAQFNIHAFNVRLTYGNILRIHFWVGFITLSMVVDTSLNRQDLLGRLFSDPLGVFDWIPPLG